MTTSQRENPYPVVVLTGPVTANPHFTVRCLTCGFAHDSPKGTNAEAETEFYERHQCANPQYSSEALPGVVAARVIQASS